MPSAREHAVAALCRIETGGAFTARVHAEGLTARTDRRGTELTAGVTRRRRYLDFLIAAFCNRPMERLEPPLKQILRIALYELLYLDTPPRAAVYEAVELAKRIVRPGAGRLVNAILRTAERRRASLPEPRGRDEAERLAILHSHPTWTVRRYLERFGPRAAVSLLLRNNARPVWGLRCNRLRSTPESLKRTLRDAKIAFEPGRWLPKWVRVPRLQTVIRSGMLSNGTCAVQGEGAGLVSLLVDPQPGESILDACAAPGGKALHAAALMHNRGRILATDVHAARLGLLRRAAAEHGASIIETRVQDLRTFAGPPAFDRVLVDAPCSGTGALAKRADLRWRQSPEKLEELCALQDALLDGAARLVKPGGLLVYATCSIEPEENEERVAAFLARRGEFRLDPPPETLPEDVLAPDGFLLTLPHVHDVDGAFGARLRRL